jgi:hypothetical protein
MHGRYSGHRRCLFYQPPTRFPVALRHDHVIAGELRLPQRELVLGAYRRHQRHDARANEFGTHDRRFEGEGDAIRDIASLPDAVVPAF